MSYFNYSLIPFQSGSSIPTDATVQQECSISQMQCMTPQVLNQQIPLAQQTDDIQDGQDNLLIRATTSHSQYDTETANSQSVNPKVDTISVGTVSDDTVSDDDERNKISVQFQLREDLQQWALEHNIKHNAINGLLAILRKNEIKAYLPNDARTLLHTPRENNIITMGTGCYWYRGVKNCLLGFQQEAVFLSSPLSMIVNIDGIPIAKSAKKEFWPILIKLNGFGDSPFVVAIYYGSSKPPVNDFLRPFVDELLLLFNNGLEINGKTYEIVLKCFICDTPARCFVKGKPKYKN